ncbi:hypothetical protein SARC_01290 [Sphaeroforma arctica JP610]|uniref:Uncharacterized protein n=1 Tax=Sphaeroforma arctica JP610 TaxID=667725 RepID=A0A0L0GC54_9EUKA|nr:hypothetical protein SARC_01290 [Sphaeroforma arctica JP610]KNC86567.1 hypothetical protein SARC_01290 [Sphaeroforma arctica JP610]|eukprot:XP_014160469.1 hypothetical protein SARC_01290 [Sphaeroforma arctica JP610]
MPAGILDNINNSPPKRKLNPSSSDCSFDRDFIFSPFPVEPKRITSPGGPESPARTSPVKPSPSPHLTTVSRSSSCESLTYDSFDDQYRQSVLNQSSRELSRKTSRKKLRRL